MAEKQVAPKMVRESDLIALKKAKEKADQDNQQYKQRIARLEKRLEIVDLKDVEDEDLKNVKQLFLDREAELDEQESKLNTLKEELDTRESSFKEREREDSIQSLVSRYAPQGDSEEIKKSRKAFEDALKDTEDPEKEALRLYAERLDSEKESVPSAEDVVEHIPAGGKFKKSFLDMSKEEFAAAEKKMQAEALAR